MNEIVTLITIYAATVVIVTLTGCSSTSGWRVSFGVAPVSSINDSAVLTDRRNDDDSHKR